MDGVAHHVLPWLKIWQWQCLGERHWPLMGCLEGLVMQTKDTTAKPALDQDKVMLILGELNVLLFFSLHKHYVTVQNFND